MQSCFPSTRCSCTVLEVWLFLGGVSLPEQQGAAWHLCPGRTTAVGVGGIAPHDDPRRRRRCLHPRRSPGSIGFEPEEVKKFWNMFSTKYNKWCTSMYIPITHVAICYSNACITSSSVKRNNTRSPRLRVDRNLRQVVCTGVASP